MFAYSWSFYFNCASLIDFKSWWFNVKAFLLHFKVLVQYGERKSNHEPSYLLYYKNLTLMEKINLGAGIWHLVGAWVWGIWLWLPWKRVQQNQCGLMTECKILFSLKLLMEVNILIELSDAELLRSPTHSESTERKSTLLSHDQKPTTSKQAVK